MDASGNGFRLLVCAALLSALGFGPSPLRAQSPHAGSGAGPKAKIVLDTDIGDDVDDAFALALALESPEIDLVGVTTAWGDTALRARMVRRMLSETGRTDIPVAEGIVTKSRAAFSQARWAQRGPDRGKRIDGVEFLLKQLRMNPGEITLVAIGPLTNVGAAIERDPATFKLVKRVVLMGGSVRKGYADVGYEPDRGPQPEYNILSDVEAATRLFTSGVPIFMMPLDATILKLDELKRDLLFKQGTPLTDALTLLYHQSERPVPTLFDAMAVAYVIRPELCPVTKLRIEVDKDGWTREGKGEPNVSVCLESDSEKFFRFAMPRWMKPPESKNAPN